jgi:hypothetical protein
MGLRARLGRLEQRLLGGKGGCRACRDRRGRIVVITEDASVDGTMAPRDPEPETCSRCGEIPERIVQLVEVVVKSREEIEIAN